jgi:hypothetical protein
MTAETGELLTRLQARTAGIIYLLNFLTAIPVVLASQLFFRATPRLQRPTSWHIGLHSGWDS